MQTFKDLGVTGLIEIPPAGTLANLAKRALPDVEVLAVKTPDDIAAARALIKAHGEPSPLQANPTWRLVVAPAKGTVQFAALRGRQHGRRRGRDRPASRRCATPTPWLHRTAAR